MKEIIKLKNDVMFKIMFMKEENKDILQDFIASVLNIPYESIKNISIKNSELLPEVVTNKFSRLDINLELNNEKLINIEMQVRNQKYFNDRTLFYLAKLYTSSLKKGEEYDRLQQSISINIVAFDIFESEEYHSEFLIMEKNRHEVFTDKFCIHFLELNKLNDKTGDNNHLKLWLKLINAESEEELKMIEQTDVPMLLKAVNVVKQMSEDERLKEIERMRDKALHDKASELGSARREGVREGKIEERSKFIETMKKLGYAEEEIKKILMNISD